MLKPSPREKLSSFHHRRILICTVFAFPCLLRPKSLSVDICHVSIGVPLVQFYFLQTPHTPETSCETRRQEKPVKTSTNGHSFWTTTARWSQKWRRKPAHMSEVPQGPQGGDEEIWIIPLSGFLLTTEFLPG